ncbi:MAG: hypothetical protein PHY40_01140 [Patescibacteria group bacterium]|nr:hypothetical protein [Patescibacteria group bacterium]
MSIGEFLNRGLEKFLSKKDKEMMGAQKEDDKRVGVRAEESVEEIADKLAMKIKAEKAEEKIAKEKEVEEIIGGPLKSYPRLEKKSDDVGILFEDKTKNEKNFSLRDEARQAEEANKKTEEAEKSDEDAIEEAFIEIKKKKDEEDKRKNEAQKETEEKKKRDEEKEEKDFQDVVESVRNRIKKF